MSLVKKGDLFTLLGWQRQLPSEMMRSRPEVRLAIAWGLALAMRFQEALELLHELELDVEAEPASDRIVLACECQAIHSVVIALKDDSQTALRLAQDCLRRSKDPWTANVATNVIRYGYLRSDLRNFYGTPWIAYSLEEDRRNVFASVYRRCLQGMAEVQQVRFGAANQSYLEGLRLAEQHVGPNSVAAALSTSLMARICYEQDRTRGRRGIADRSNAPDLRRHNAGLRIERLLRIGRRCRATGKPRAGPRTTGTSGKSRQHARLGTPKCCRCPGASVPSFP